MLFRTTPPGGPPTDEPAEDPRSAKPPASPSDPPQDPLDVVVDGLDIFDRSVVDLVYGAGHTMRRIADALTCSPDQVSATLMGVYRQIAAALESGDYAPAAR